MRVRSNVYDRWSLEMRRGHFFRPGERIGVAVSGGPDSVLLLDFLDRLSRDTGFTLAVIHFNHHLRGTESEEDEEFVRNRARELHLPFLGGEARVAEEARKQRRNLEATARDLRYRFFLGLVRQGRVDKVATAHTLDDQAETVLIHILRGTGTKGLGGIHPSFEGKIIRPFLSLTRHEIETTARERKLPFRVDSTNLDTRFRRNKVRLGLLPLLEKEYNPEVKRLLSELAARAREDEAYLEQQARERAGAWRMREGGAERIPRRVLAGLPPALARRVLRQMVQAVMGSLHGVTYRHIEALQDFSLKSQSGRKLLLPHGLVARTEFEWLILCQEAGESKAAGFAYAVVPPGTISVAEIGRSFTFKVVDSEQAPRDYISGEWPELNPLNLPARLLFRNWQEGDRYCPTGHQKPVRVKELFRRHKVPAGDRFHWPVLDSERGIVCVRGLPAAKWAVSGEGKGRILLIQETALG
ncbi:MAG: tRNA lysidine(34) synthetase TilS [Acidobacteria bacterium]|nr:tRNA lysidine(34) synthetase TilS [Acidobacteriota bacterium]